MDVSLDNDPAPLRMAGEPRSRLGTSSQEPVPPRQARLFKAIWTLPALAFSGVTFLLLSYLCQSAQIVRAQYRIVAVRGEVKELQAESADLELSISELTALERIERLAIERLAMEVPTQRKVIEVSWQKALERGSEVAALP